MAPRTGTNGGIGLGTGFTPRVYEGLAWPWNAGRRAIEQLAPASSERFLLVGYGTAADLPYLPAEGPVTALPAVPSMVCRTRR